MIHAGADLPPIAQDEATRREMRDLAAPLLTDRQMQAFCLRHGLNGQPPMTNKEIARCMKIATNIVWHDLVPAEAAYVRAGQHQGGRAEWLRRQQQIGYRLDPLQVQWDAAHAAHQAFERQPDLSEAEQVALLDADPLYRVRQEEAHTLYGTQFLVTYQRDMLEDTEHAGDENEEEVVDT